MKVIFLGLFFCEESLQEAYRASKRVSIAAHKFQTNLLSGLRQCEDVELFTVHVPPTGSFPINYKKLYSKPYAWEENSLQIGYLNLPIIKHWIQERKLLRLLKRCISKEEETKIVVYTLYEPYLKAVRRLKELYPKLSVCLIQTDPVPGRGDFDKYMKPHIIRRGNRLVSLAKSVDSFVLLTEYLAEPLEIGERPRELIECVACDGQLPCRTTTAEKHICLYAGGVAKAYGLCELADAFTHLPEAELWVCGGGDAAEYISTLGRQYANIKYFGFVTAERVVELQNECDYLVNPRRPNGGFTKYSFPSKTVEYMMTEKPVLMYRLEGLPAAYDEYLTYLSGENGKAIAEELRKIFAGEYAALVEKGKRARAFVLSEKSGKRQAEKLAAFLREN